MVALVPQLAAALSSGESDATGFHMIYLPYRDDMREEHMGLPTMDPIDADSTAVRAVCKLASYRHCL
jgi:hypothetical protein